MERGNADFMKVCHYFEEHNPFDVKEKMMTINSGVADDTAEDIGSRIQKKMEGKAYWAVNFKRAEKLTNLQSLHSTVKIHGDKVDINPTTLFLGLITVIERQPNTKISSFF